MGEAAFSSIYGCTADVGLTASAQPKPLEAQQPPFCPLSQEARWSSRSLVTKLQFMCVSNQTRFCTLARDTFAKVTSYLEVLSLVVFNNFLFFLYSR